MWWIQDYSRTSIAVGILSLIRLLSHSFPKLQHGSDTPDGLGANDIMIVIWPGSRLCDRLIQGRYGFLTFSLYISFRGG
ncbi:hypothetical protein BDV27DRAFT_60869 [Aspergillus caelatus]|uniref:Uncharacterized protein n=1 Tax=Aspergillus caelatus TaxID=61420 RepID=A0A5N6ZNG1_9EURO|nr:uncharacterized protein BDV27DRAFT_60869 [Aspergillus caelatus]KAE8358918.1 hypothetical protein BDV27DRAFT_60869 [Aspergillus caelatus]